MSPQPSSEFPTVPDRALAAKVNIHGLSLRGLLRSTFTRLLLHIYIFSRDKSTASDVFIIDINNIYSLYAYSKGDQSLIFTKDAGLI